MNSFEITENQRATIAPTLQPHPSEMIDESLLRVWFCQARAVSEGATGRAFLMCRVAPSSAAEKVGHALLGFLWMHQSL